jgi:predicted MFS family arabinose efflux permease
MAVSGHTDASDPGRLLTREMTASLLSVSFMFTGMYMVVGVIPIAVRSASHGGAEAGLVTTVMSCATITANLATPAMLSRRSSSRLLTESLLVATAGAVLLAAGDRSLALLLASGAVLGLGLGVSLVMAAALVTTLAPAGRRASAVGIYGVAASAPVVFAPSLGLWLSASVSLRAAFLAAAAACLLGAAVTLMIPSHAGLALNKTNGLRAAMRAGTVLRLFLAFAMVTLSYGALLTLVPISLSRVGLRSAATFLLVMGVARVISRPLSGVLATRLPNHRLYLPALLCGWAGAILFASSQTTAILLVAPFLIGLGMGAFQSASFVGMLEGVATRDDGAVSSLWNFAFDGGVGIGASGVGILAGIDGYRTARWLLPAALAVAVAIVVAIPRPAVATGSVAA